ncbi:MAG: hypothetical protein NC434_10920 [Ruminococcus sp.]|nr:hypothetical protein [Ruminococcus sp.]
MLNNKKLIDKLYDLPQKFRMYMNNKDYPRAKHCYDTAVTVALFMELDADWMTELFGERGERGVIIQQGLFPEEKVQKAYMECIKKDETHENKKYAGIPKTGCEADAGS